MDRPTRSDDALMLAVGDDPAAFGVIYRRHAGAVFAYLLYRTRSAEPAAELTAEVFAAAFEASGRFRPGEAPVRAWLFGIANHKLADSARRRRIVDRARRKLRMERIEFDDAALERAEELADLERAGESVGALVADLPDGEREAVLAHVVDERSYAELAQQLNVSRGTVRKRVSRGLTRVATRLKEETDERHP